MFLIDLKNNIVVDVVISEKYNNINIYEYKYLDNNNILDYTYRFIINNKKIWFKLDKNNNQIKRVINKDISYISSLHNEDKIDSFIKHLNNVCKNENIKQEIIKSLKF